MHLVTLSQIKFGKLNLKDAVSPAGPAGKLRHPAQRDPPPRGGLRARHGGAAESARIQARPPEACGAPALRHLSPPRAPPPPRLGQGARQGG
eukprot:4465095-Pyramimonas_sp.AAC.1